MNEDPPLSDTNAPEAHLDRSEFVRTEFLDRVAHELRGPAGVTLGALDELELSLGEAAETYRTLFAMARRGAFKVLRTADRLTRTAQLEAGVKFHPVATDLKEVVRRACVDASRVEERSKVKFDINLPDGTCTIPLDASWAQAAVTEDRLMEIAIEAGAEDVHDAGENFEVITAPADFETVKEALEAAEIPLESAEITKLPSTYVDLKGKEADQMIRLMDMLDDCEDVQKVYTNADIPDEMFE